MTEEVDCSVLILISVICAEAGISGSLGHGDVDFESIIRVLNAADYQGPLSVEWEDSGMDRIYGATEAAEFVRSVDFPPSDVKFDDAIKSD